MIWRRVLNVKTLRRCVALELLLVTCCGCNRAQRDSQHVASSQKPLLPEGEYLSTTYIEGLKRTASPFKAGGFGRIDLVLVSKDGTRLRLQPIINFHEGSAEFELQSDGKLRVLEPAGEDLSNLTVEVQGNRTLRLGYGEYHPQTYVFVNKAADYVAKMVLVGKYRDGTGKYFEFREDGSAIFPDRKFRFEMGIDHVLNNYDYFMDTDQHGKTFAFRHKNGKLDVFRTADGTEKIVGNQPLFSLHPVRAN